MRAERTYGGRSFKAQMKVADRSGARYAVLLGEREAEHGAVGVKDMQSGEQVEVPRAAGRRLVAGTTRDRGHRAMMRTDRAGDLRSTDIDREVVGVRVGRRPPRPRRRGVPRRARRRRHRAGGRRPRPARRRRRAPRAQRVRRAGGRAPSATGPRARSTTRCRPVRSRSRRPSSRCSTSPTRRRSPSTTASRPTRCCGCATATSTCAARACSATSACARR